MKISISSLSPIKVFLSTWFVWLVIFSLKPFEYTYNNFNLEGFFVFLLLNFFFLMGMFLGNTSQNEYIEKKYILNNNLIVKIFKILFFLAICSCFLRLYSIFFIQNYFSFESNYDFKMSIMYKTSSAGLIGILSSMTLPSTLLILYLNLIYKIERFKSIKGLIIIIASLLIAIDSFLKSSFLAIVVYFLFLIFSLILKRNYLDKKKFEIKFFLFLPILIISLIYFGYITQFRVFDIDYILYDRNIVPNKDEVSFFDFTILNFIHYMLHGYYQWIDLYNVIGLNNYYFGFVEFYPIIKFFKTFIFTGLPSMNELLSVLPRGAVYYTFWGDFILDWGLLSFPISLMFGYFSIKTYINFKKKYFISTIFYPFILILIFFMPYLNLASGLLGYFIVFILILKFIVTHHLKQT